MPYRKIKLLNGKTIDEHRLIMQEILGRNIYSFEEVHHKDEDKNNNSASNLCIMYRWCHKRLHTLGKKYDRPLKHGKIWAYKNYGCRCSQCKDAKSIENAKYRKA